MPGQPCAPRPLLPERGNKCETLYRRTGAEIVEGDADVSGSTWTRKPLRIVLIAVAVVFCLSAWCDYLATLHTLHVADHPDQAEASRSLMVFFRDHGTIVLLVELAALAIAVLAVMLSERDGHRGAN